MPHAPTEGLVVSSSGRHCMVETPDGRRVLCHPRGKRSEAIVGDRVLWTPSSDEGRIEQVLPRRNLLYRQDEMRTKSFAANLDQVLVLVAGEPAFSAVQLSRALIAAESAGIAALVACNKRDLTDAFADAWQRLAPYRAMGYRVLGLAAKPKGGSGADDFPELERALDGRATLVLGPSGAGKSTLINRLVPSAGAQTQEISAALRAGKHTTTRTSWYWVDRARGTALIDSPGFQEFGLRQIAPAELAGLMPDLRAHLGGCRFYNCTHLHEPGCALRSAISDDAIPNAITTGRYKIYSDLLAELSERRY